MRTTLVMVPLLLTGACFIEGPEPEPYHTAQIDTCDAPSDGRAHEFLVSVSDAGARSLFSAGGPMGVIVTADVSATPCYSGERPPVDLELELEYSLTDEAENRTTSERWAAGVDPQFVFQRIELDVLADCLPDDGRACETTVAFRVEQTDSAEAIPVFWTIRAATAAAQFDDEWIDGHLAISQR